MRKIRSLMKTHRLDKVFVATDAVRKGMELQCSCFFPFFLIPGSVLGRPGTTRSMKICMIFNCNSWEGKAELCVCTFGASS